MEGLEKVRKKIIKMNKLDEDLEPNLNNYKNIPGFYELEGVNKETGEEEIFLIYDCSVKDIDFDYGRYAKISTELIDATPIFLFKDWDDEMEQYFNSLSMCRSASEKKKLSSYFEKKLSFYTDIESNLKLYVKDPENFNEYILDGEKKLEGYIYNFSLKEIKKLFRITGKELFRENVRQGLKKNSKIIQEIIVSFKNYLYTYLYSSLIKEFPDKIEEIKLILDMQDYENIKYFHPEYFWFCHNGITIFSYDEYDIDRSGNYISLNPDKVSVINGAQTLTNFYYEFERIKRFIPQKFVEIDIDKEDVLKKLDEAYDKTSVKTIIICGEREFVKPITYGLNKQVPILPEHILADSSIVRELNEILIKKSLKILKEGDILIQKEGLTVLEFIKKYYIIEKKPGKSKNFSNKSKMEETLKKILDKFKSDENKYLNALEFLITVDNWWKENKKFRDELNQGDNNKIISSYGKNYFGSYLINESEKNNFDLGEDSLEIKYNKFFKLFEKKGKLSASDFKKDKLFEEYLASEKRGKYFDNKSDIDTNDMKRYLEKNVKSPYTVSSDILRYLNKKAIELDYFRVIKRVDNRCKEAYPFPSSCFTEIYQLFNTNEELYNNVQFEQSKFQKEIIKQFDVFVIEYIKSDEIEIINKINYIKNFSFESYKEDAKKVFKKTLDAFYKGDELLFPKASENISFHIRPKAKNNMDTFEFTNGEQITKRTFWANKSIVDEIINKKLLQTDEL